MSRATPCEDRVGLPVDHLPSKDPSREEHGSAALRRARCPELAAVSDRELQELYETVVVVAHRRASRAAAEDIVQRTFESLLTTRRWNPAAAPLAKHVTNIVRSLIHHHYESKASQRERLARDGFQREVTGEHAPSAEESLFDRAEEAERQARAAREAAELEARVAGNSVAHGALRCRREGLERPADIALALNVSVEQVYRATQHLRYHLKRIREGEET